MTWMTTRQMDKNGAQVPNMGWLPGISKTKCRREENASLRDSLLTPQSLRNILDLKLVSNNCPVVLYKEIRNRRSVLYAMSGPERPLAKLVLDDLKLQLWIVSWFTWNDSNLQPPTASQFMSEMTLNFCRTICQLISDPALIYCRLVRLFSSDMTLNYFPSFPILCLGRKSSKVVQRGTKSHWEGMVKTHWVTGRINLVCNKAKIHRRPLKCLYPD